MDFISSPSANLPNRHQSPKSDQKTPRFFKTGNFSFQNAFWQHFAHTQQQRCVPHLLLSELVDTGGAVRTTKRVVVNIVVKGGQTYTVK